MNERKPQKQEPIVRTAECEASPEEVKYDGTRLQVLNRHIQSLIDEGIILSGSYCLWRQGKVFADAAIGSLACPWQGRTAFLPDTFFEIQSVGKVFTAIAILKLMEDGFLYLGQSVREWLPEFDCGEFREITIQHLLTHTSGLCALEGALPEPERKWWEAIDEEHVKDTWIPAIIKMGLHCKPGENWIYSIVNYALLGEIIQRASGMDAEEFIRENILLPCQMHETHWRSKGTAEQVQRYNVANETDIRMAKEWETKGLPAMATQSYKWWKEIPDTAGAQMSTAREMMHLGEMLLRDGTYRGKRVLGREALSLLFTNLLPEGTMDICWGHNRPIFYGAGLPIYSSTYDREQILSENVIYHEGSGTSVFLVDRQKDFVAMFQTSFRKEFDWDSRAVKDTATIIWSGLK